ncbi:DMT family transporter [Leuconostoc falkenbergense]|uniref:DMT family transporter n=1 Tax=Leuconostoc falkenbergense TaxID=2766470 RepID=UPI0024AD41EA|nr:DMT family transporter [Leuconostoc falkenbergense]MDI6666192.1 DMT family transporter [Leuconostoc falkenbergense]
MLYFIGLAAGFLLANQSAINAKLGAAVRSPFRSSLISFSVGTIFLIAVFLGSNQHIVPIGTVLSHNPWWIWLGGILGVFFLTSNILMFPKLGAIQTIILPILGQVLMGEVIDIFGLFGAQQHTLTWLKSMGILILFLGIYIAVVLASRGVAKIEEKSDKDHENAVTLNLWRLWGIVAGAISAIQQAINGHLGQLMHSSVGASVFSFLTGTILILLVVIIRDKSFLPKEFHANGQPFWLFIGGVLGAAFVFAAAYLVPQLGTGVTVTLGLFGSIVGSMAVTQFGWWRSPQRQVTRAQIFGIMAMAIGVLLIKFG